jgi:AraC-like DNA-binding protein
VGFTEQSSLAHAVRRWFGLSPRGLRRVDSTGSGSREPGDLSS